MKKTAYITPLTYNVSDEEKHQAQRALICFKHTTSALKLASEHLNIMKTPFKNNEGTKPEDIYKARVAILRFRDKSIENFNKFKDLAFQCVLIMQEFASDTQTVKLIKSFIASVDNLQNKVNIFVGLFTDLKSTDFNKNIVSNIEDIQKQCDEVEKLIEERLKTHIQSNILATTWVDTVGDEKQIKLQKKQPILMDLYNKQQEQLNQYSRDKK